MKIEGKHTEYGLPIALSTIRLGGPPYSNLLGEEDMELLPPYPPPYAPVKHVMTPLFDSFLVVKWPLNTLHTLNTLNSIPNPI
jgi:hypothetical protein